MAEVLGVVTGGFAVAELTAKLGVGIIKLKKIWDEAQDVPEQMNQLVRRLELLKLVLAESEASFALHQHEIHPGSTAEASIRACHDAAKGLETLATDLQNQVITAKRSRRHFAKFKVSLKKDLIQECQANLDCALTLLSFSQNNRIISLMSRPTVHVTETAHIRQLSSPEEEAEESGSDVGDANDAPSITMGVESWRQNPKSIKWQQASFFGNLTYQESPHPSKNGTQVSQARVQLPWWMSARSWDFQAYRACTGWQISLTPWRTRPTGDKIFVLVCDGSLPEVLEHLNKNQASLYDRTPDGQTLLDLALESCELDVAKALVNMGLDLGDIKVTSLLGPTVTKWFHSSDEAVMDLFRFLAPILDLDEGIQDTFTPCTQKLMRRITALELYLWYVPQLAQFLAGQGIVDYYHMDLDSRFSSLSWGSIKPQVLLEDVRRGESLDPAEFRRTVMSGGFHNMNGFVERYFWACPKHDEWSDFNLSLFAQWRELARWILTDISVDELSSGPRTYECPSGITPLFHGLMASITRKASSHRYSRLEVKNATHAMRYWLEDVRSCGVDLVVYGRSELERFLANTKFRRRRWTPFGEDWMGSNEACGPCGSRLLSFTYGPEPDDWQLIWDLAAEEFAGQFWDLVENPRLVIPGRWVDDDETTPYWYADDEGFDYKYTDSQYRLYNDDVEV